MNASRRRRSSMRATELVVEAGDDSLTRPTISSARRSSVCPIGVGLRKDNLDIKALPTLEVHRRKGPLICAKLCDTMHQSTAGHVFELSNARVSYPFLEYNSLHDPHLKSYFYQPEMKQKLIENGFVTNDLYVICRSLKEYNAYRNFLESEFMKLYKAKEDARIEKERREKCIATETQAKRQSNAEREEKRKQFFKQQEKKLQTKELHLQRREKQEYMAKMKALEERRMQRERNEIRREAEREQRKLRQLRKEYEEASRRKSLLRQCEADERMRQIHLTQMRKEEKEKHLNELEKRWQKYEEHAQKVKEEHEAKRAKEKEDRERRIRKREKIFQLLRKREEERQAKLHEENHHQVEQLKEQADHLEKKWQKMKENEVFKWKETIQKKREHWDHYVIQQKEATKKEHNKHLEDLLKHTHLPSVTIQAGSRANKKFGPSKSVSHETARPASVRFNAKPTVHIIEDTLSEELSMEGEGEVIDIEEKIEASIFSDQLEKVSDKQTGDSKMQDLDHRDSYDIQLEKMSQVNKSEDEEALEQKSSMDLSHILEETGCVGPSSEERSDKVTCSASGQLEGVTSVSTLLSQQKSTASDLVGRVLEKAVEIVSGSQIDISSDSKQ